MSAQEDANYRWIPRADEQVSGFDRWLTIALAVCGVRESPVYLAALATGLCTCLAAGLFVVTDDVYLATGAAIGALGVLILALYIWQQVQIYQFSKHLPTAIALLSRSVESGDSLAAAMRKIGSKMSEPLGNELRQFARQMELGLPMGRFLKRLDERYGLPDLRMLGSTLLTHERSGGDLGHMLKRLALVLSDRQQYRQLVSSVTVTARMSAIIVGLAGPLLFLYYLLEKEYAVGLLANEGARSYLLLAGGLELVGIVWLFVLSRKHV